MLVKGASKMWYSSGEEVWTVMSLEVMGSGVWRDEWGWRDEKGEPT